MVVKGSIWVLSEVRMGCTGVKGRVFVVVGRAERRTRGSYLHSGSVAMTFSRSADVAAPRVMKPTGSFRNSRST